MFCSFCIGLFWIFLESQVVFVFILQCESSLCVSSVFLHLLVYMKLKKLWVFLSADGKQVGSAHVNRNWLCLSLCLQVSPSQTYQWVPTHSSSLPVCVCDEMSLLSIMNQSRRTWGYLRKRFGSFRKSKCLHSRRWNGSEAGRRSSFCCGSVFTLKSSLSCVFKELTHVISGSIDKSGSFFCLVFILMLCLRPVMSDKPSARARLGLRLSAAAAAAAHDGAFSRWFSTICKVFLRPFRAGSLHLVRDTRFWFTASVSVVPHVKKNRTPPLPLNGL